MGLKDIVIPQDKIFFELFEQQAEVVVSAAGQLVNIFTDYTDVEAKYHVLKEIEHKGDDITHRAHDELNRTFITPFEPEEISRLINTLDDVVDFIDEGARFLVIYEIKKPEEGMLEIAKCLRKAAEEIRTGIKCLRTLKDTKRMKEAVIEISRLENEADDLQTKALKQLFATNDPIYILKMKDVFEHFEEAADRCKDVADVLTAILIRHT